MLVVCDQGALFVSGGCPCDTLKKSYWRFACMVMHATPIFWESVGMFVLPRTLAGKSSAASHGTNKGRSQLITI